MPEVKSPSYFPIVFVGLLFIVLAIIIGEAIYIYISSSDWSKIRCLPHVMPFASLYGYDTTENFRFCISESFKKQAGEQLAPFYKFFAGFIGVLSTLIESTNSLRVGFATFMGGFVTIASEFGDRFKMFMSQIRLSAQRIKMLMYRIYATFYAMMYMALSSIRAVNNFGGTALFGFLDTFCFAPDTLVTIREKGTIPISDVKIGDIFASTGSKVTARFQFMADGQPMVQLPGNIIVSTNHYILFNSKWIRAEDHPDAIRTAPWLGGKGKPIICFNTHNNTIPVGNYIFRDYDETTDGMGSALRWTNASLNGVTVADYKGQASSWREVLPAFDPEAHIKTSAGTMRANQLELGMKVGPTNDTIIGIIDVEVNEHVETADGRITPGTLIWNAPSNKWERLGDIVNPRTIKNEKMILTSLIVLPGCRIEFASGLIIRDYMEVASPWAEEPYSSAMSKIEEKEIAVC